MTRILFMHQTSTVGGGSYCLLNIIRSLDRTIWEPLVVLKSPGPLEKELHQLGVDVVFFPEMTGVLYNLPLSIKNLLNYWKLFRSLKPCRSMLQRERPDVVYLNNMMIAPYLKPAKELGCKTVLHVREHWPLDEHRHQLGWIRKTVYACCDTLVAINHFSASIFPKMGSTVVYDGIDMGARFKPMPMEDIFGEDMRGKKVLLYTGGADYIKGVDYVLQTFTQDVKGEDYRLLMLGCESFLNVGWKHRVKCILTRLGYHYWGKELQEMADADPRIRRIPPVYELSDLVKQAHCFVSYFRVPHANLTMAECIILGTPCIAADTEEAREYSDDGRYACLVTPLNDREAFAQRLKQFLDEIDQWRMAAKAGSEKLERTFDMDENSNRLNKVLLDLRQ